MSVAFVGEGISEQVAELHSAIKLYLTEIIIGM